MNANVILQEYLKNSTNILFKQYKGGVDETGIDLIRHLITFIESKKYASFARLEKENFLNTLPKIYNYDNSISDVDYVYRIQFLGQELKMQVVFGNSQKFCPEIEAIKKCLGNFDDFAPITLLHYSLENGKYIEIYESDDPIEITKTLFSYKKCLALKGMVTK